MLQFDLKFDKILETENVAELLTAEQRFSLGNHCFQMYEVDLQSNDDYYQFLDKITVSLEPFLITKNYPYPGSSNINVPLIINASIAFSSRAYSILFKDSKVCYAKVLGDDSGKFQLDENGNVVQVIVPEGVKRKRADRVSEYMSYQLLYEDSNWEEDTDKLLLELAAYGEMYRKRYYDTRTLKQCSVLIHPKNLIVHNETIDFEKARKTEKFPLYPHEIKSNILSGYYEDFTYVDDGKNEQHEFIEQHERVDLDGDGYAEPYIITVHTETKVAVRVVKNFSEDKVEYSGKEISNIPADNYYIRYSFIPNPKGKFRAIGFGYLLYDLNENVNSSVNQINDAGRLANTPAILAGRGLRMKGGETLLKNGRMHFVDSSGGALRDNIYEIRFPEPSATLYNLATFLIGFAKELGGLKDALTGELRSDLPANTALAMIEQGMNEFKSIFKRIYRAMTKEFKLLYQLNAEYLSEFDYREYGDGEEYKVREDFKFTDLDIVPVADFSALTSIEKQYKATVLREMAQQQLVSPKFAAKYTLEAMNIADVEEALNFEATNQELQLQQTLADAQMKEATAKMLEQENKSQELAIKASKTQAEIGKMVAQIIDILEQAEARNEGDMLDNTLKKLQFVQELIKGNENEGNKQGSPRGVVSTSGDTGSSAIL